MSSAASTGYLASAIACLALLLPDVNGGLQGNAERCLQYQSHLLSEMDHWSSSHWNGFYTFKHGKEKLLRTVQRRSSGLHAASSSRRLC